MEAWINELEANARKIPEGRQIVVIPTLNPDGVAANSRYNSAGIDLNRNFQTADWVTDITTPSNQPLPGGGGPSPLSEPESQAIANFTLQIMPRLTMSFHSSASYAIGNQGGDSAALASTYSSMTGYRNMTGNSGAFSYPITGTYDDWIRERCGLASVLVELSSSYSSEFSRNKAALWAMARS
jgi:predicted deacylase